jgi:RNA polymerase sigma-70 factor (subfamily 1)
LVYIGGTQVVTVRKPDVIRPQPTDRVDEFVELLNQARQFLLGVANDELPAALRAKGGASDLVQETFAAALHSRHQFRGSTFDDLRAWLRAILRNKLITFYRHYSEVAARDVGREVAAGRATRARADDPSAVEAMIRAEEGRTLSIAVTGLPDDMRAAVALRMEHGLAFAEIGGRLGRSEEAARKLFTRAIDRLRGTVPDSVA